MGRKLVAAGFVGPWWWMSRKHRWNDNWQERPAPEPVCPPQILRGQLWDLTWAFTVRSWWLTACFMLQQTADKNVYFVRNYISVSSRLLVCWNRASFQWLDTSCVLCCNKAWKINGFTNKMCLWTFFCRRRSWLWSAWRFLGSSWLQQLEDILDCNVIHGKHSYFVCVISDILNFV